MLVKELPGGGTSEARPEDLEHLPGHSRPRLKLIDDQTGEIQCEDCGRARGEAEEAWRKLEDAEKELRQYRAKVRRLENEKAKERMEYLRRAEVEQVFNKWRLLCKHPRSKLTNERFDAVQKLLDQEYTVDEIGKAITYIAAFPFMISGERRQRGKPSQQWDDLELICRNGGKMEKFATLGYHWERQQRRDNP